jgi:transposase
MGSSEVKKDRAGLAVVEDSVKPAPQPPDPEVSERPVRRQFTTEYKLRILREADHCTEPGTIGSLLRREGLYSSLLSSWRQQRDAGALGAAPRKRGRPATPVHPDTKRLAQVEHEKRQLERRLKKAELLLDLQKKVSEILEIELPPVPSDEDE